MVKAVQGRILWDKDNPGNDVALCRSYDFLHPDGGVENPPSQACARQAMGTNKKQILMPVCPKAKWNGKERPECGETFNLLCILIDDELPFWITLHGTSIQPVRRYLSAIAIRRYPLWQFQTVLSTEVQTNDRGKYFIAKFDGPTPISEELEGEIVPIVIGLKDADVKRTFDAEEAALNEDGDGAEGAPGPDPQGHTGAVPAEPDWLKETAPPEK